MSMEPVHRFSASRIEAFITGTHRHHQTTRQIHEIETKTLSNSMPQFQPKDVKWSELKIPPPSSTRSRLKPYNWCVAFFGSVIEIVLVARPEADVRIEPPLGRRVHSTVAAQMPLAHGLGFVPQWVQVLRQELPDERQRVRRSALQRSALQT